MLKEKIIIIIIKNYLKKKNPPAGFKLAKPVLLVFLAAANSGGLAKLFSIPDQHSGSLQPCSTAVPDPQVQACTLLGAMGVHVCPSEVHTLPDALDVCVEALQDAHSPWCF